MPMQYKEFSAAVKVEKFQLKSFDFFCFVFAQNIDSVCSNEYPQSVFYN